MSLLDRARALLWPTAHRGPKWRGTCDYCTADAEIAYTGPVVERLACRPHVRNAASAHQFDQHMRNAVQTGRCKAEQSPTGQWSGGFTN